MNIMHANSITGSKTRSITRISTPTILRGKCRIAGERNTSLSHLSCLGTPIISPPVPKILFAFPSLGNTLRPGCFDAIQIIRRIFAVRPAIWNGEARASKHRSVKFL
jgi:hypothetical protein